MMSSEIDVRGLLDSLWRQKLVILVALAANIVIAILYLNIATYVYAVTLIVTPVQPANTSLSSKFGGLAGLAGISLPTDSSADAFKLYIEGLKSRPVADALARDQWLMKSLFPNEWAADEKKWREPFSVTNSISTAVRRSFGFPVHAWEPPDGSRVQEVLQSSLNVVETRDQPAMSVVFTTTDPQFGVELLNRIHQTVDGMIKKRVLVRASDSIAYLQKKLQREAVADYRQVLIDQEAQQEQLRMMASASVSYAADPFGTPTASRYPVSPRPLYVMAFALVLGLVVGIPIALARNGWEKHRRGNA